MGRASDRYCTVGGALRTTVKPCSNRVHTVIWGLCSRSISVAVECCPREENVIRQLLRIAIYNNNNTFNDYRGQKAHLSYKQ